MDEELETRLRQAMRPASPGADFADRVMARVTEDAGSARAAGARGPGARETLRRRRWNRVRLWGVAAGLAAALTLGIGVELHVREQRELQAGLQARRELLQALRVTNQKFDLALHAVRDASKSDHSDEPGV